MHKIDGTKQFLIERKQCKNPECGKMVVKLINDEYCEKCYQSIYYQKKTKKKRRKKKKDLHDLMDVWYLK